MTTLKSTHQAKKQCNFDSGYLEQQQGGLNSFLWSFSQCCNKVERKYIQEQQPNQIHYYIQTWVLSTEWTSAWLITGLIYRSGNKGGPHLFEW